jgi:hypothetical protein
MNRFSTILTGAILSLCFAIGSANAQNLLGRWAIGVDAGANYWITDYNEYKVSFGGQVVARYEIARYFGLGLAAGYEVLKTNQSTPLEPGVYDGYIRVNAIPVSVVAFIHFFPRKMVNPYVYIGAGVLLYQRWGPGLPSPRPPFDGSWNTSYLVPAGFGIESFINNDISFDASVGFTSIGNDVDARTTSSFKGYATAKIGLNFYLNEGPPRRPASSPAPVRF